MHVDCFCLSDSTFLMKISEVQSADRQLIVDTISIVIQLSVITEELQILDTLYMCI